MTKDEYAIVQDDLATLRGSVLRVVVAELTMLQDGLYALRRGKPHVTIDHMERAIDGLADLVARLRSDL